MRLDVTAQARYGQIRPGAGFGRFGHGVAEVHQRDRRRVGSSGEAADRVKIWPHDVYKDLCHPIAVPS